jgi:hypothetical protein
MKHEVGCGMSSTIARFSVCLGLMACLAGCGGSSNGGGGGNPTIVTYTFTDAMPTAVATQIGSGAYTQASLQSGKLSISVPDGTTNYSVAWVCPNSSISPNKYIQEEVYEKSTADGTSFTDGCYNPTPQTGLATLQVNAVAIPGATLVAVGDFPPQTASNGTLSFSGQMPAGTFDVAVVVFGAQGQVLAVRILRSQTVPGALNGGNAVVFATSDETVSQAITYSNLPTGFSYPPPFILFETSGGAVVDVSLGLGSASTTPPTQFSAMPAGAVESGDYYLISSSAYETALPDELVAAEQFVTSSDAVTLAFPAPWIYSGPSAAALPTFNFSYTGFAGMPGVSQFVLLQWEAGTTSSNLISVYATENYQNGATAITIPDLSGLTGFTASAPSGTSIFWSAGVEQNSVAGSTPPKGNVQSVQNNGTYTEP